MLWSIFVVSAAWRYDQLPSLASGAGADCGQLAPTIWICVKLCSAILYSPRALLVLLHRSVSGVTKHSRYSGADPVLNILLSSFLQNIFIEHLLMLSIGDRAANTADTISAWTELISL